MIHIIGILAVFFCFTSQLNAAHEYKIIKYLSENHVHGPLDDHISYEIANETIKQRPLEMTCGAFSYYMLRKLTEMDIKCRFILTMTWDDWNDYNNGHSMIEVWENNRWVLYDCDLKNIFTKNKIRLNALDLCRLSSTPEFDIIKFARGDVVNNRKVTSWYGLLFNSEKGLRQFYRRCCQLLCIEQCGYFYFTCEKSKRERIISYPYTGPFRWLSRRDFMRKFYSELISCEEF